MNTTILLRRLCVLTGAALLSAVLLRADEASNRTIRLNHFSARWDKVLGELAEASGKKLVAEQVPDGRFSRRDRSAYSLPEAVRILNSDLEPLGFRLVDMGEYLVVLELSSARARYQRPILRAALEAPSNPQPARPEQPVTPKYQWKAESVVPASERPRPIHAHATDRPAAGAIQQVGYSDQNEAAAHEEQTQLIVHVRRQPAADVGQKLYQAFRPRAELIDHGPRGLPAFRVVAESSHAANTNAGSTSDSSEKSPSVRFTIGLDAAANDVLIEAPKPQAQALANVIERMDLAALERGTAIRLLSTTKDAGEVARRLQRPLAGLFAQNTRGNNGRVGDDGPPSREDAENEQNHQPTGTEKKPLVATPKSDLPALIGGLKGEVTVEAMDDLGLLILRGNEQDVEAVMQVIRQIEQLSARKAPEMHLRFLKHADGQALTELLTSVYEKVGEASGRPAAQTKTVAVVAVIKPNAILILAPAGEMESILDLVDKLDHPVDPLAEFTVFNLKHAVASQVVTMLETFFAERGGLGTRVRVIADVRTNAVVVQAQPRDLEEVTALVRKIDQNRSGAVNQIKFFSLKNAIAEDLVNVVNQAIQSVLNPPATPQGQGQLAGQVGAGQSSQQLREAKSAILQFLTGDGETKRVVRSGILADIRVTADPRMNSLVVTAPEQSMELMAEVIQQLDMPSSMVAEIKHFTLANADATSVAQLLEELFGQQGQQGRQNQQGQAGFQVAGAEDASSSVIPLRFSVDVRTNSIIAIGGAESLQVVEALLLRLDASDIRQRQDTVYRLKNSPAADVANAINQFLSTQRQVEQADPNLVSPFEQMEREVVVVPELVSNSLLISATPRYYDAILELIAKLDAAPSQVNIQALLVEVSLDNTDEFGVELGFQDSVLFNRSLINPDTFLTVTETMSVPATGIATTTQRVISQEGSPGFLFNQSLLGNNVGANASHPSKVGTQGLSNFQLGRVNGDLGFGGLVLSAGSESVHVLLRALAAYRHVDILSRPLIRAVDNQLAQIQVGQEVPRVNGFQVNQATGAANPLVEQAQAGIILTVTPRITPEGQIVMEVVAEKSQFSSDGVALFTDASTGNVIESPIKDITTARTTVSVGNNQTIVLGGMITKTDETIHRKVPWLGDIPLLGKAFRYDSHASRRTELLIFLTPRIIRTDEDSEMIKQIETERIHFTEQDAEEIHGPIFAVPADIEPQEMAPPEPLEQAPAAVPPPELPLPEKGDKSMSLAPPEIAPLELFPDEKFSDRQQITKSTVKP